MNLKNIKNEMSVILNIYSRALVIYTTQIVGT